MSISLIVIRWPGWCWSGCSPASRRGAIGGRRSRSARRSRPRRGRRRSRAVSRTFVERTREALGELMARQLGDLRLAVMMLDGIELKGRMMIVALGITTEGVKVPLGLWEGSTENATVATALLVRPRRARPGPRAGHAVRARRRQGAAEGGARGVRRGPGAALHPAQGAQRARASARARPPPGQGPAAPGVARDRPRPRARAAHQPRRRARPHPPRRGRLAARRDGGDADRDPARDHAARSSARWSPRTRASR